MTLELDQPSLNETLIEKFAGRLFNTYTASMLTLMIDVADRTGLLDGLARGGGTSQELAERTGLIERYVRECLGSLVTGGVVEYAPTSKVYTLPPEHAVCLTGDGSLNVAPMSRITTLLARHVDAVVRAFRDGGGVPYEHYRPDFTDVMDGASRGLFDGQLLGGILPTVDGLLERLNRGIRVADIGCGTGHAINVMAKAFPASRFYGYDISEDAIARARAEAVEYDVKNATFEVLDVITLPSTASFDAVFAFDAIHDQIDPAGVLARVRAALAPDGVFVMMDIKASSQLQNNVDSPLGPWLYGVSTLHCMTVSLAHGGAGLGTVWGRELASQMLIDAGFARIEVHDVPDDPLDVLYVAR